jgi:hypothetical protein
MPMGAVHGENKKRRTFCVTDAAFNHLEAIAKEAEQSKSETLERLIRSTPIWEGSATLSNGAWEECFDHTKDTLDPDKLFPKTVNTDFLFPS